MVGSAAMEQPAQPHAVEAAMAGTAVLPQIGLQMDAMHVVPQLELLLAWQEVAWQQSLDHRCSCLGMVGSAAMEQPAQPHAVEAAMAGTAVLPQIGLQMDAMHVVPQLELLLAWQGVAWLGSLDRRCSYP